MEYVSYNYCKQAEYNCIDFYLQACFANKKPSAYVNSVT